ncbi:hypothetical protein DYB32_009677, partial [Aphanomyces invadans]
MAKPSVAAEDFTQYLQHLKESGLAGQPVQVTLDHFTFRKPHDPSSFVLHDVHGTLEPGSMTLVLGPPQSGKSALLKTLAGVYHYKGSPTKHITGSVSYNGLSPRDIHVHDIATFVGQTDEHIPTLTVLETFEFAHACRGPSNSTEWQRSAVALVNALGLTTCANTRVGNEMLRGISGGQRRRVSLGEMVTGQAPLLLLDEYTTGLDTTVALALTTKLRDMCKFLQYTLVCSLLQPPPEVFELFDNIVLLNEGHVCYFGPRTDCVPYFRSIGYVCPGRLDAAEFIQHVSTDLGKLTKDAAFTGDVPCTPVDFSNAFRASPAALVRRHAAAIPLSQRPPHVKKSLVKQFALVFQRQLKLVRRDKRFNRVRVGQSTVFGVIIGSLFWQLDDGPHSLVSKAGLFFLTILFTSMTTISNIAYTMEVRNIYIKQSYFQLYPAAVYAVSESAIEVAATLVQVLLFTVSSYWMCGFSDTNNGMPYGFYYVVVFLNSVSMCQLFKCCGAVAATRTTGLILAATFIFIELVFSGFAVRESVLPDGLKWIYWLNPASWAFRGLVQNEFSSPVSAYDAIHPRLHIRMGHYYMALMGVSQNLDYMPGAVVYLLGFFVALVMATSLAYHTLKHEKRYSGDSAARHRTVLDPMAQTNRRDSVKLVADQFPVDFAPVTLSFRDLRYTVVLADKVKAKGGAKYATVELLRGIHGHCRPHTLTALMGSSGAGKSTLLDVLAGRKNSGTVAGDLFVQGRPMTKRDQRRFGYVEQTDMHCMRTTVVEAFEFSARLRLPESGQRNARNIIQSTLGLLELGNIQHASLTTLSGEQMKRVTIGVELVANPSVLFLYVLFDDLILLQTGGLQVYCGPVGLESSDLLGHFESIANVRMHHNVENPATYMLDVMTAHPEIDFHAIYSTSAQREKTLKAIEAVCQAHDTDAAGRVVVKSSESTTTHGGGYATSFGTQFWWLLHRMCRKYWRTREYSAGRVGVNLFVALLLGLLFSAKRLTYTSDVDSQMGLVFIAPLFMGVIAVITGLPVVDAERMVFFREHSSGMYAALPYSLAVGVVELPYVAFNGTVFVVVFYYLVGLHPTADALGWFYVLFVCYTLYATYLGQFLVTTLPDVRTATVVSGALNSVFSIFSGYFIHRDKIPAAWSGLYW